MTRKRRQFTAEYKQWVAEPDHATTSKLMNRAGRWRSGTGTPASRSSCSQPISAANETSCRAAYALSDMPDAWA